MLATRGAGGDAPPLPRRSGHRAGERLRRACTLALPCVVAALLWCGAAAQAQSVRTDFYGTNGTVNAEVLSGNTLYLGGSFTRVGPQTGCGVPLDAVSGAPVAGFPLVLGQVNAVAPDGAGGWYLGGSFTSVGGLARSNLARVLADNSVSAWNPGANGIVRTLVVDGGVVYVGGEFSSAGGQVRSDIAALDAVTGLATTWAPQANGSVRALAASGGIIYAGGQFLSIGGQARNRIAALDATTGLATAWAPGSDGTVRALAVSGGMVYAGGFFSSIGGQVRGNLAALDAASGLAVLGNPNATGQVATLVVSGGTLFVGGAFGSVGGKTRSNLAALDPATGLATAWNPGASAQVLALAVHDGLLYAGGDFLSVGGQARGRIAAVDVASGSVTAWDPSAYGTVSALAADGGTVYAGGSFAGIGGLERNNLAALDVTTGAATTWAPSVDGQILGLAMTEDAVYLGGGFTTVGGQPRGNLAAVSVSSGLTTPWNPGADGQVLALDISGETVYAGGLFSSVGGQSRDNLAALDATSGLATSWNPGPDGQIVVVGVSGGTVYAGGSFSHAGGQSRNNLAALDAATGSATAWNPDPNGTIRALALGCGTVYVGGFFTTIGTQARNRLAALDATTGLASGWNPGADGPVLALTLSDGTVYAGGVVGFIGGQPRNRVAALDPTSGAATSWNPNANGTVRALVVGGGSVYAGGSFGAMGSLPLANVAAIAADHNLACSTIALTPPTLPAGVVGATYAQTLTASGGTAPYCYAVTAGQLPPGLVLDVGTGALSGTPTTVGAFAFSIDASDVKACSGTRTYVLSIFSTPAQSNVAANTSGLCISPAHPCVRVPFVFDRAEASPALALSVTFQIDLSKLALCTTSPWGSIHAGTWLAGFSRSFQVVDNGGGSYTVDQAILGTPCGATGGGQAFTVDLKSVDGDGSGALTVTAVSARDCSNNPIAALPGSPAALAILNSPIAILPGTLPGGSTGVAYSQALTAAAGAAPFTFALSAGELPDGLALSSAGSLSGTPTVSGTFSFTVGVTDANDCTGSQPYSLDIVCSPLALRTNPPPAGVVDVPYSQALRVVNGRAPFTFVLADGELPPGLVLAADGVISGSPTAAGTSWFTVGVSDANGCSGSRGYLVNVFATAPQSFVAADPSGLCISVAHSCVSVPFVFTRADAVPARALSATFQLDVSKLALCTPANPAASVHVGSWLAGYARSLQVIDNGGGSYTVDQAILGGACGATGGGQVFTVDLKSVGDDGAGLITTTAVSVRDCGNLPIPAAAGAPVAITIDYNGPTSITDLAAAQVLTGNGTGGTTGIALTWASGGAGTVSLYRAPFGSYPEYDDDVAVTPPNPTLAPGTPWTLAAASATSGYVDHPPARGFWHYVALVTDECGSPSTASNMTSGTLDYHLGDVSDGVTVGQGNNHVGTEDISLLGANYGIGDAEISARHVEYLDVGPTTDGLPGSRPKPDDQINFEDLMIFATNYTAVSGPALATSATGAQPAAARDEFIVLAPSLVAPGPAVTATLRLRGAGRIQGFSAQLGWNASVVRPLAMQSSRFIEAQGGVVLSPRPGAVDAALLGARSQGMAGDGIVAMVTFEVLRAGDAAIRLAGVVARDPANRPIATEEVQQTSRPEPPGQTLLFAPTPNPFRGRGTLTFSLAEPGPVELSMYSVDGRRVRTLASGPREAGVFHITWDGADDGNRPVAPGVFYARLSAAGRQFTKRLVYLR